MIDLNSRVIRSTEPLMAKASGSVVMFSPERGAYFGFNPMGSLIWERIERAVAVGDLCVEMQARFDVTPERCAAEVLEFLRRLESRGLVGVAT